VKIVSEDDFLHTLHSNFCFCDFWKLLFYMVV